jgi:hypothetical protein
MQRPGDLAAPRRGVLGSSLRIAHLPTSPSRRQPNRPGQSGKVTVVLEVSRKARRESGFFAVEALCAAPIPHREIGR